ncbi:hypothetical protein F5887DRAFT_1285486 [Amanita rubescens]|nr:hypothetical protein F5887DRAFT_1285486 [Amanita rubescens]
MHSSHTIPLESARQRRLLSLSEAIFGSDDDDVLDGTAVINRSEYAGQHHQRLQQPANLNSPKSTTTNSNTDPLPQGKSQTHQQVDSVIPIDHSDINLEPDYQRGQSPCALCPTRLTLSILDLVWPERKQIAVNTFDDGSETRTCMDRKQPLYRFMDRYTSHVESSDFNCHLKIPHKDHFTVKAVIQGVSQKTKSAKRKTILPDKYRRLFSNKLTKTNEKLSRLRVFFSFVPVNG